MSAGVLVSAATSSGRLTLTLLVPALIALFVAATLWGARRIRRARHPLPQEQAAYAEMDRLCPSGWQATITVSAAALTAHANSALGDASDRAAPAVTLQWREFTDPVGGDAPIAVERRLTAPDVGTALGRMVEDRRTDALLEDIESRARSGRSGHHGLQPEPEGK